MEHVKAFAMFAALPPGATDADARVTAMAELLKTAVLAGQDSAVAALLHLAEGSGSAERLVTYEDSDGATALILACTLGHYRIAQHLLLHTPERQVLAPGVRGHIALIQAADRGHAGLCRLLLRHLPEQQVTAATRRELSAENDTVIGDTALMRAVCQRRAEVFDVLLQYCPLRQVQYKGPYGVTPLLKACMQGGCVGIVRMLLRHEPARQLAVINENGATALVLAVCESRCADTVAELLRYSPDMQVKARSYKCLYPLLLAASGGWERVVAALLCHNPGLQVTLQGPDGLSALMLAVGREHEGIIALLLQHEPARQLALQSVGGRTALTLAVASGRKTMVQQLLAACAPDRQLFLPTTDGSLPIHLVCATGEVGIARALLAHCPKAQLQVANHYGCTPLHEACRCGHADVVRLLLRPEYDPDEQIQRRTGKGETPLLLTTCQSIAAFVDVAQVLLQLRPDWQVLQVDESGMNALMYTASGKVDDTAMVRLLLRHSPQAQLQQRSGGTGQWAITLAAQGGLLGTVRLLLKHDPLTQIRRVTLQSGNNALLAAVSNGHYDVARELLRYDPAAQLSVVSNYGESPLYIATGKGQVAWLAELLSHVEGSADPKVLGFGLLGATNLPLEGSGFRTAEQLGAAQARCCEMLLDAGADAGPLKREDLEMLRRAPAAVRRMVDAAMPAARLQRGRPCRRQVQARVQRQERAEEAEAGGQQQPQARKGDAHHQAVTQEVLAKASEQARMEVTSRVRQQARAEQARVQAEEGASAAAARAEQQARAEGGG